MQTSRCKTNKISYYSEEDAEKVVQNTKNANGFYKCKFCRAFHITTHNRKKK
jgi:hypothetical protein